MEDRESILTTLPIVRNGSREGKHRGSCIQAWISGLEEGVAQKSSDPHEPRHYAISKHAMDKVTEAARGRIKLMRASDRADSMKKALQAEA